ncbi:MAG TPA: DNA polymerase III subunit delta [Bacteroidota bacterium]|nr:DNA polymerase III subunit delta [Bacteroidota bacterium]
MAKSGKERVSVDSLLASIKKSGPAPVYFLYGEEDFLIDEVVDALLAAGLDAATRGFNLDVVHGSDADGKDIVSLAASFPMMSERRVVVVRDFDRVSNKELLQPYLENPSPSTCLVLIASKPDTRKKPYPFLKQHAAGGEFNRLYDSEIPDWIQRRAKKLGSTVSPEAAELLHAYVGNSLREVSNQIEKLLIAVGARKSIGLEDVESIVGVSKEYTVFELTKMVGEKNAPRSLEIVERMLDTGESPQMIIVMLTRHFIILAKLRELRGPAKSDFELAGALRISPYFVKEYISHLQRYTQAEIENAFLALAKADRELKSTGSDQKLVMDILLCEIMEQSLVRV